jgi:hypothetical protein
MESPEIDGSIQTQIKTSESQASKEFVSSDELRPRIARKLALIVDYLDPEQNARKRLKERDLAIVKLKAGDQNALRDFEQSPQEIIISRMLGLQDQVLHGFENPNRPDVPDPQEQDFFDFELYFKERLGRVRVTNETLAKTDEATEVLGEDHVFGVEAILALELILQNHYRHVEFGTNTSKLPDGRQKLMLEVPDLPYTGDDIYLGRDLKDLGTIEGVPSNLGFKKGTDLLVLRPNLFTTTDGEIHELTAKNLKDLFVFLRNPLQPAHQLMNDNDTIISQSEAEKIDGIIVSTQNEDFLKATESLKNGTRSGILHSWGLTIEEPIDISALDGIDDLPKVPVTWRRRLLSFGRTARKSERTLEDDLQSYYESKQIDSSQVSPDGELHKLSALSAEEKESLLLNFFSDKMMQKYYARSAGEIAWDTIMVYLLTGRKLLEDSFDRSSTHVDAHHYQRMRSGVGVEQLRKELRTEEIKVPAAEILVGGFNEKGLQFKLSTDPNIEKRTISPSR